MLIQIQEPTPYLTIILIETAHDSIMIHECQHTVTFPHLCDPINSLTLKPHSFSQIISNKQRDKKSNTYIDTRGGT